MTTQPQIKRKKSIIILAWIIPIIALLVSYGMIKKHYDAKGNTITIYVNDLKGLDEKKSHIEYKGIKIADIISIKPNEENIDKFEVKAQIYSDFEYLIKEGTQFWIVSMEVESFDVANVGTVLTGSYIEILPPTSDVQELKRLSNKLYFTALDTKPYKEGKIFSLKSNEISLPTGAKVLYKGMAVGEVIEKKLLESGELNYKLLIYEKYKNLVGRDSFFYNTNPINFELSLEKLKFEVLPVKNFINGSISFVNDRNLGFKDNRYLYKDKAELYADLISSLEKGSLELTLVGDNSSANEKVFYKNIEVGYIKSIYLDGKIKKSKVLIYKKYKGMIHDGIQFYRLSDVSADLSLEGLKVDVGSFKQMFFGGISFIDDETMKNFTNKEYQLHNSKSDALKFKDSEKYFYITVGSKQAFNIKKTSKLFYKDVEIGEVEKIELQNNVETKIKIDKKYKELFGINAKIYLQGIQLSLDEVKNVSSSVLGDNLYLIPSINNGFKDHFAIDSINPVDTKYKDGLRIKLIHKDSKNLSVGTLIFYKHIEIGKIEEIKLNGQSKKIEFSLFIEKEYRNLIKDKSIFTINKAVDLDLGLFSSKIEINNLKTILKGGLSVETLLDSEKHLRDAKDGDVFEIIEKNTK